MWGCENKWQRGKHSPIDAASGVSSNLTQIAHRAVGAIFDSLDSRMRTMHSVRTKNG